ncbi:PTS fructose transporter subunit IIABC [Malacoplasma iowae]|uniref:PTS fructose transporter subunit IIABC n=1 Tax=Malacoplasma iowae TaxID=2116 RepID=UPI002A188568|nr:fructose-specific PTS transporter subunit EIIC [Malacoplasma iowae]WPL40065.1 fructose-specific PTS transporter subunit EIIC [Malacoplasma iowae]
MDIKDFLKDDLFIINETFKDKKEALTFFSNVLKEKGYALDSKIVLEKAMARENEFSTGIGNKIAIPHIRDNVMKTPVILFAKVKPMDWQSLDGQKVEVIFFIALDQNSGENSHLEVIANLSRRFMDESFIDNLLKINTFKELITLLSNDNQNTKNNESDKNANTQENVYDVVAITACPTGIAHTFMAAQSLEKAAKEMGIKIKVETQGTEGPKNVLTQEEINNAKGVIIAVDKVVDLSRFSGKENVLEMGTKAVIKDPKKEINRILNKEGKTMSGSKHASNPSSKFDDSSDMMSFKGFGKRIYKGIMNGVSYMLPFVVFGGIMIALAFLIDINNAGNASYGEVNDAAKWFKRLGGISFDLLVPILCAYMCFGLVGKFGLLPGFVCGFISNGKFLFNIDIEKGTVDWFANSEVSSGFFGAIGGAILTSVIIIVLCKYVFVKLPQSLNGIKNILFIPLIGTLLIAAIFWICNIPLIFLNWGFSKLLSLINSQSYLLPLLGLLIGIMMAFDLGGPINKAAYLFSIATLQDTSINTGNGTVAMAASMASGMVPPLGIALAATFFKNIFDKEQRQAALTNYIMGISFVSEGAIPFTAEKPKVMIPANIVGGAITGLLVGSFQITLNAPHGGVFVFPLVQTSLFGVVNKSIAIGAGIGLYLVSIIVGSLISMLIIWILNRTLTKKQDPIKKDEKVEQSAIKPFWKINKKDNQSSKFSVKNYFYKENNQKWYIQ